MIVTIVNVNNLKETENGWLVDLLLAFNTGDVERFRQLKSKWSTQADLAANEILLFEKVGGPLVEMLVN